MTANPFETQVLILRYGIIVLIYAFLAAVLYLVWKDLRAVTGVHRTDRQRGERPQGSWGQLVVVDGAEAGLAAGDRFPLQLITSLGRDLANTIILPDVFASNSHALLTYRDGEWWLEDLDSRNGTFVNNTRVTKPTVVRDGDVITVGRVHMRLACPS